jgi:hypothetical protein
VVYFRHMHLLIGLHAGFGEMGALAFLWVLVELLNGTEASLRRAKLAAGIGAALLFLSWFAGGYYYLGHYQADVKALIKGGPDPWAHTVITETKEHVFMFLPFLALLVWGGLAKFGRELGSNKKLLRPLIMLSLLIVLVSFAMAGMGYLISSGLRSALEHKVL